MTLEIRPTDDPNRFDLYEDDDKIGEIDDGKDEDDFEEDGAIVDSPPIWFARIWSQMGTGKTFSADSGSLDEIKQYAHELYEEMVAERRELRKGSRPRVISTPMGGQRRR